MPLRPKAGVCRLRYIANCLFGPVERIGKSRFAPVSGANHCRGQLASDLEFAGVSGRGHQNWQDAAETLGVVGSLAIGPASTTISIGGLAVRTRLLAFAVILVLACSAPAQPIGDAVTMDALGAFFDELKEDGEDPRYPLLSVENLKTGHVGRLPYAYDPANPAPFVRTKILCVVDEQTLVVQVSIYTESLKIAAVERFSTQQPVDQPWLPAQILPLIVKGVDTTDLVDGQAMELTGVWKVTGTGSYKDSGGKRTAHVIEPTTIRLPK